MVETAQLCTLHRCVLIVGASRGLGAALVDTYAGRGAHVVVTARDHRPNSLRELATREPDAVEIERVDVADRAQLGALKGRLATRTFELLFVVAGYHSLHRAVSERTSTTLTSRW